MKKRILLVDDEPDVTMLFKHRLEQEGYYEVLQANDTSDILDVAREFMPDLIILDIMMPDLDGTEVAEQLRDDSTFMSTPIIFLTALVTGKDSHVSGGQTFLPKDVALEKLIACIEEKLRLSQAG
jgi:DNA-binding response OmpR family regulator